MIRWVSSVILFLIPFMLIWRILKSFGLRGVGGFGSLSVEEEE